MKKYRCENWFMQDIAKAMKGEDDQGRKIIIPLFQRGKRWSAEKKEKFLNSLLQGYPVGTLLFAERGDRSFSVIDGLQRSTTICEYVLNPTKRENLKDVDEATLNLCRRAIFPSSENRTIDDKINEIILNYLSEQKDFNSVQLFYAANRIIKEMPSTEEQVVLIEKLIDILTPWFEGYKKDFETILKTEMPIIIYSNNSDNLHEIFERINKQGEPLTDYEIYAASWRQEKYPVNNVEIVENVIKKYDSLVLQGYELEGYDSMQIRRSQKLTAFEYLFGLGKFLINKYDFLNLDSKKGDSEVTTIGFELFDACINSSKSISRLDQIIFTKNININKLERRIKESIDFVKKAIAPICDFKGNKRKKQYLHPKYFILALIAFVLHEMYDMTTLEKREEWQKIEKRTYRNLQHHYVFGLVNNEWHEGGIGKMYSYVNDKSFAKEISRKEWDSLLEGYFARSNMAKETKKVANPTNADNVLLNCIYVKKFSVHDQLSDVKFDIEHLATKDRMKKLISSVEGTGLPISSFANLCYLPENINRKKKDKTIYEQKDLNISIEEIEDKYSFTYATNFDFIYLPYQKGDEKVLQEEYMRFLEERFKKQKEKIFEFLNV